MSELRGGKGEPLRDLLLYATLTSPSATYASSLGAKRLANETSWEFPACGPRQASWKPGLHSAEKQGMGRPASGEWATGKPFAQRGINRFHPSTTLPDDKTFAGSPTSGLPDASKKSSRPRNDQPGMRELGEGTRGEGRRGTFC